MLFLVCYIGILTPGSAKSLLVNIGTFEDGCLSQSNFSVNYVTRVQFALQALKISHNNL